MPRGPYGRRTAYLKVRDRSSYEFAVVSVEAAVDVSAGVVRSIRLAAGGVATRPWRLRACEDALVGKPFERGAFETAAAQATPNCRLLPGTAYKAELLRRTVVRALEIAGENA